MKIRAIIAALALAVLIASAAPVLDSIVPEDDASAPPVEVWLGPLSLTMMVKLRYHHPKLALIVTSRHAIRPNMCYLPGTRTLLASRSI